MEEKELTTGEMLDMAAFFKKAFRAAEKMDSMIKTLAEFESRKVTLDREVKEREEKAEEQKIEIDREVTVALSRKAGAELALAGASKELEKTKVSLENAKRELSEMLSAATKQKDSFEAEKSKRVSELGRLDVDIRNKIERRDLIAREVAEAENVLKEYKKAAATLETRVSELQGRLDELYALVPGRK